jgi:hypothetical protein
MTHRSRVIPKDKDEEVEFLCEWLNQMRVAGRLALDIRVGAEPDTGFRFVTGKEANVVKPGVLALAVIAPAWLLREELEKVESNG